jgi:hypothetical protein
VALAAVQRLGGLDGGGELHVVGGSENDAGRIERLIAKGCQQGVAQLGAHGFSSRCSV